MARHPPFVLAAPHRHVWHEVLFGRDLPFPYGCGAVAHFLTVLGRRSGDAGGDGATVSSTMIGLSSRMMLFITTVVVFIINNYFILHIIIIINIVVVFQLIIV